MLDTQVTFTQQLHDGAFWIEILCSTPWKDISLLYQPILTVIPTPICPEISSRGGEQAPRAAYLIVFSIRVAATVVGQDAALAIEDIAGVTLAALHAVVAAVALQPDGGTSGLAQGHAALVVAVGGTADS